MDIIMIIIPMISTMMVIKMIMMVVNCHHDAQL